MLTRMTDEDWARVVQVVRACRSRRGQGARRPHVLGSAALVLRPHHHLARSACGVRQLELGVEAVLAAQPGWRVRGLLRRAHGYKPDGPLGPDVRLDRGASACLGRWGERGQQDQALGRSRGGFSTKIHLKVDLDG